MQDVNAELVNLLRNVTCSMMFVMASCWAAIPELVASDMMPPSKAATRFSNTSLVGFWMRE